MSQRCGEGGKATAFPKPIGLGATWDVELVKRISTAISDEARAKHRKSDGREGVFTEAIRPYVFLAHIEYCARPEVGAYVGMLQRGSTSDW